MDNIGFVLMPLILHNLETNLTLLGFVAYENITLVVIPVFSYNVKLKFHLIFFSVPSCSVVVGCSRIGD